MTNHETDCRETVEYFVQCQQPDGTWEQASSTATDLDFATERLAARRRMQPEFVYRIAQRTTVVVVGPVDAAAVSVPPPATRADDRAAAFREAAEGLLRLRDSLITEPDVTGKYLAGIERSAAELRRMAADGAVSGPCVAGEQQNETQRLALSEALGLGTGAPWDTIRDRAAELAAGEQP